MGGCITEYTWRSEDNLQDSVLSFYYVGPKDETPVIRFVGKWLCLLSISLTQSLLFYIINTS